jgi:hypothetical protein
MPVNDVQMTSRIAGERLCNLSVTGVELRALFKQARIGLLRQEQKASGAVPASRACTLVEGGKTACPDLRVPASTWVLALNNGISEQLLPLPDHVSLYTKVASSVGQERVEVRRVVTICRGEQPRHFRRQSGDISRELLYDIKP